VGTSGEPRHDLCEILLGTYGLTIDANDDMPSALDTVTICMQVGSRRWGTGEDVQYFDPPHPTLDKRFSPNAQIRFPHCLSGAGVRRDGGYAVGPCRDGLLGGREQYPVLAEHTGSESQQAKDDQTRQKPSGGDAAWHDAFDLAHHCFPPLLPPHV
jgi:hypothetical protein